jgi:hypothetical protein
MSATEQELEEVQGLAARGQQVGGSTHPDVATATLELGLKETGGDELHGVVDGCEIGLSSRFGGDSSVGERDLDAGAAEVDHCD